MKYFPAGSLQDIESVKVFDGSLSMLIEVGWAVTLDTEAVAISFEHHVDEEPASRVLLDNFVSPFDEAASHLALED